MKKFSALLSILAFVVFALMIGSAYGSLWVSAGLIAIPFALGAVGMKMPSGSLFSSVAYINPSDLTFSGEEAKDIGEAVINDAYNDTNEPLSKLHSIKTGIKTKKQIPFIGELGMVGKKKADCDVTPNAGAMSMSEKFWEPAYITDRLSFCWAIYKDTFFEWKTANGLAKEDPTRSMFAVFLQSQLTTAMKETAWRLAYFGDTAADDSSAGGILTSGTDEGFFTPIDGIFKQSFDIVTADSTKRLADAGNFVDDHGLTYKNAQANIGAQRFNATDTTNQVATKALQEIIFNADMRLRNDPNAYISATQTILDQYARERSSLNLESGISVLENGIKVVTINGVKVYGIPFWDRYISTYYNNGTKLHLPHRLIYTTPANLAIGTEEENNLEEIDAFYSKESKNYIIDFGYNYDTKVLKSNRIMLAY